MIKLRQVMRKREKKMREFKAAQPFLSGSQNIVRGTLGEWSASATA